MSERDSICAVEEKPAARLCLMCGAPARSPAALYCSTTCRGRAKYHRRHADSRVAFKASEAARKRSAKYAK